VSPDVAELIDRVRSLGVSLKPDGDRLVLAPKGALPDALRAELVAHKPEVLAMLRADPAPVSRPRVPAPVALRAAYRRWFELTVAEADGQRITPAEAETLHQAIVRLTDEAGPLWADALFADELRAFRAATARCGLCGGLGHAQGPR
jgi:tubulysin polyketide synthase-like protein